MELQKSRIGILALGWLGLSLAEHLSLAGAKVWGSVRSTAKRDLLAEDVRIETIVWENEAGISKELALALSSTDVLILNLPPRVFQNQRYAEGLLQFLPFLPSEAKVLFTSSTGVYPDHLLDAKEDHIFRVEDMNPILEAENRLKESCGNRLTIMRLAGLIGSDRHPVYHLVKKETNVHPEKSVNLIQRQDVLSVIEKVISSDYFDETLNVCHPYHPSRKSYYENAAIQFNLPKPHFTQSSLSEADKVVNSQKLVHKLGFNNFTSL